MAKYKITSLRKHQDPLDFSDQMLGFERFPLFPVKWRAPDSLNTIFQEQRHRALSVLSKSVCILPTEYFVVFSCYVWPQEKAGGWDFTVLK